MMGLPNPTCNARITVGVDVSTNWRRRSTRACKRCKVSSANGLTNRLRSGCWCSTPSERRQHFGVQAVGLGQSTHGTGEVAGLARIDHRHIQACRLQRAGSFELVAARGFEHHQRGRLSVR